MILKNWRKYFISTYTIVCFTSINLQKKILKKPVFKSTIFFLDIYWYMIYTNSNTFNIFIPPLSEGGGGILFFVCRSFHLSFRPSKIFFIAFFSVTVDGRNLIFGHKRHIGIPYCGKRFWTRQIPTSCLPI
jgi:hypothetical protein